MNCIPHVPRHSPDYTPVRPVFTDAYFAGVPLVIGLSGIAGSGKTTVGKILAEEYGYRHRHPLQSMKDMLKAFGLSQREVDGDLKEEPCEMLCGATPRHAQLTLGTEWGRRHIHPDLWTNRWLAEVEEHGEATVNESVRFPSEAIAIRNIGGIVIRIENPRAKPLTRWGLIGKVLYGIGLKSLAQHPAERAHLIPVDEVIVNDGTIDDLRIKVRRVVEKRRA